MKQRQWKTKRQLVERPDAQCRWDQAYQCLLRWTSCPAQLRPTESTEMREEKSDESDRLRTCINPAADANADYRAAK
jgi:hypothetical protein